MFDEADQRFAEVREELRALLDEGQWRAASRNTLNAHYTDAGLAQAAWGALQALGFSGGRVLEPGCGAGTFIGLAPPGAEMVGVELDPTTAAICSALYPGAQVLAESFADTSVPEGYFDAAIGNVPFGKFSLTDPAYNAAGASVHNHFILKSLHFVRPGGVVALLTSRYTLDARNPAARREMAELADLVAAVRLPEGAHRRAAGTEVVTDLVVFRRRGSTEVGRGAGFERSVGAEVEGGRAELNEYFAAHPAHVLGQLYLGRGAYGEGELSVRGDADAAPALREVLAAATAEAVIRGLGASPRAEGPAQAPPVALVARASGLPEGFIEATPSGFRQVQSARLVPHEVPRSQEGELRALCELRDTLRALLEAEATSRQDRAETEGLRAELNRRYDGYVAAYGPVNRSAWRPTGRAGPDGEAKFARVRPRRGGFSTDPFAAAVDALELFDPEDQRASKAPVFHHRVVSPPPARLGADTPEDALAICLDDHGEVRLAEVARLLGIDEPATRAALGPLVFDEPVTGRLVPRAEYCSGNVRAKLAAARAAALDEPRYLANVEALAAVLPADLGPAEIQARLGAAWIEASYVEAFLAEVLEDPYVRVEHAGGSEWQVRGGRQGVAATSTWGTTRRPAGNLAEALLKQAEIKVVDQVEDRSVPNATETAAAQEKAAQLGARFSEWCWEEPERASALAGAYNERFNSIVLRSYDGAAPALPGLALNFEPRAHQLAAVARVVGEPASLLAHEVGAGKTASMVIGAMELRRLGLAAKPMVVVPNHMVAQFSREWLHLYPRAALLVANREDLAGAEGRRRFVARTATGEWDGVIISHSAFGRIPLSPENYRRYLDRETDLIRSWLERSKAGGGLSVKRLERKLLEQQERIKRKLATAKADSGITFEQTGVDYLFVDEAHLYKNLHTPSNIASANIDGSDRAQDLHMKIEWLRAQGPSGRCVTFATATPVANSVTEAYVMQRYLRPDLLAAAGIEDFDTWAATFGEVVPAVELSPDGNSFRTVKPLCPLRQRARAVAHAPCPRRREDRRGPGAADAGAGRRAPRDRRRTGVARAGRACPGPRPAGRGGPRPGGRAERGQHVEDQLRWPGGRFGPAPGRLGAPRGADQAGRGRRAHRGHLARAPGPGLPGPGRRGPPSPGSAPDRVL